MTLTVNPDPTPEQVRLTVVPGGQLVHAPPLTEELKSAAVPTHIELGPLAETLEGASSTAKATPEDETVPQTFVASTV